MIQSKVSLAAAGLTRHGTQRALPSGGAKPGWSQQGQLCWLCGWAEQAQIAALCPSKALLARRRELRGSLLLPSTSGDGMGSSLHSLPLQQLVLLEVCAGLMDLVLQAQLQKGLRGYKLLFLTQTVPRISTSSPQQVRVEQHPCEKGGSPTETRNFLCFTPGENASPPSKRKDSAFQNNKCLVNMKTKGLIQLPPMQRKPQNPTRPKPQCWWVDSCAKEPLSECSSWFLRSQLLFMQSIYTFSWLFMQRNYFIV